MRYNITKDPGADNVAELRTKDLTATPIEITKGGAAQSITFQEGAVTKVRIVKSGGETLTFSPSDISSIHSWFLAGSGTYNTGTTEATNNQRIITWVNQTGGNNLTQATADSKPFFRATAGPNSLPIIDFDGIDDFMATAAFTALSQPNHIFLIGSTVAWTLNDTFFDGGGANESRLYMSAATPNLKMWAGSASSADGNSGVGTFHLHECLFKAGTLSTFIVDDNASQAAFDAGAGTMSGGTLGALGDGLSNYGSVEIAEFMVFDGEVTGADLTSLRAYINDRYGIATN